jgi:hypothetical protein
MTKRRAAVAVAASKKIGADEIVTLSTGVRVKVMPVTATLIDEVQSKIADPEPPMIYLEEKDRSEPNYSDPRYLRAIERAQVDRVIAAVDALVLFGVELVDGLPEDTGWIKKLKFMEKLGTLDLSSLDLGQDIDQEFAYKRYIAVSATDIATISQASGLSEGDVAQAEAIFRGKEG